MERVPPVPPVPAWLTELPALTPKPEPADALPELTAPAELGTVEQQRGDDDGLAQPGSADDGKRQGDLEGAEEEQPVQQVGRHRPRPAGRSGWVITTTSW